MFINLTNETVYLFTGSMKWDDVVVVPPSGEVAQVIVITASLTYLDNVAVKTFDCGKIIGLPNPQEGVYYIVDEKVARQAKRPDLVCPDSAKFAISNDSDNYLVSRGLLRYI